MRNITEIVENVVVDQKLTKREAAYLKRLAEKPGETVTRIHLERLHDVTEEARDLASNATDVHIKNLRKKLAGTGLAVETVRGEGYRLVTA